MATTFKKLNDGWNAEPNGHEPHISMEGTELILKFLLNDLKYPEYKKAEKGILRFSNCWRYRLGETNDEGWYRGQCRFSRLAPKWGELYEVHGDLLLDVALDPRAFHSEKFRIQLPPYFLNWIMVGKEGNSLPFLFARSDIRVRCGGLVIFGCLGSPSRCRQPPPRRAVDTSMRIEHDSCSRAAQAAAGFPVWRKLSAVGRPRFVTGVNCFVAADIS